MENREQFLQELHDLLEKYNVEISIGLDGDTHGLDSWISIEHRPDTSFRYVEVLKLNGEITAYELKPHLPKTK